MEAEHGARLATHLLLVPRVDEHGEAGAVERRGRLDDVRDVALVGLGVEVAEVTAAVRGVGAEVEVGAVGDALELAPAPREAGTRCRWWRCCSGTARRRRGRAGEAARADAAVLASTSAYAPRTSSVPFEVRARLAEELHLHLLELAGAEDGVARRDLVAKRLALLGDAEGQAAAHRLDDDGEVDEHTLRRLRSQVHLRGVVSDRAQVGAEHEVELARLASADRRTPDIPAHPPACRGRAARRRDGPRASASGRRQCSRRAGR